MQAGADQEAPAKTLGLEKKGLENKTLGMEKTVRRSFLFSFTLLMLVSLHRAAAPG